MDSDSGPVPHRRAAFFDFDDTLIRGDSLPWFLGLAVGWPRTVLAFLGALLRPDSSQPDRKSALKAAWLARALKDLALDDAHRAASRMRVVWKEPIRTRLLQLHQEGVILVLATGAMDVYIHTLVRDLPFAHVMATEMEVNNGRLTGRMRSANCVRAEKARRVALWLKDNGPFTHTFGFGNAPSDLPMLALLNEQTVV